MSVCRDFKSSKFVACRSPAEKYNRMDNNKNNGITILGIALCQVTQVTVSAILLFRPPPIGWTPLKDATDRRRVRTSLRWSLTYNHYHNPIPDDHSITMSTGGATYAYAERATLRP